MEQAQRIKRRLKRLCGFTLVEILIVVAIIGLLLAIAIPSWNKTRQRTQRDICIENLQQIETAKQLWALETGESTGSEPAESDLVDVDLYLRSMPKCPAGGQYWINAIGTLAECEIEGHELDL